MHLQALCAGVLRDSGGGGGIGDRARGARSGAVVEAVGAAEGIFGDDEIGGGDGEGEDGEVAVDRGDGLARGEGPETDG